MKRRYGNAMQTQLQIGVIIGIIAFMIGLVNKCQGQQLDSINNRILKLEIEQRNIQLNLDKGHKQFRVGTMFIISGVITTIGGTMIYNRQRNDADLDGNKKNPFLLYAGSLFTTAGVILQLDAHKFIGRAGRRRK